ncbi:MAG: HAMP domain-containing sensor histidine kinase [Hyphomicrobiaceae bacterium]
MHPTRLVRSAPFRLAALYTLVFAASVLVLGGLVFWITHGTLHRQFRARIEVEATALAREYESGGLARLVETVRERERAPSLQSFYYRLADIDGKRIAGTADILRKLPHGWSTVDAQQAATPPLDVLTLPIGRRHQLSVAKSPSSIMDVERALFETFGWFLATALFLALAGGAFLSARFLDRVDGFSSAAQAIMDGNTRERMPVHGTGDEIDRLAETLNGMLDRISELLSSLQQVTTDIAHDLRTPLTRMRQRLEAAVVADPSKQELRAILQRTIADTDDILTTFSALLRIAQIESGSRRAAFATLDLAKVTRDVADAYAPSVQDGGRYVETHLSTPMLVRGDRELLTQLLANLIENAMRHTPPGITIAIDLARMSDEIVLSVADNGPGVPPDATKALLAPFFRLERSRTTPGSGLGLSLVKAVADLHGATIELTDNAPGLRVAIHFPRSSD